MKKLIEVLEKVWIINKKGGDLKFELSDNKLSIWNHDLDTLDEEFSVTGYLFTKHYTEVTDERMDMILEYLSKF